MEKLKSRIINAEITNFKNKTTGEVNVMTKITYTYPRANSEISYGPNILTCYRPGNIISKINSFINSKDEVLIELDERVDEQKSTVKKILKSINSVEV